MCLLLHPALVWILIVIGLLSEVFKNGAIQTVDALVVNIQIDEPRFAFVTIPPFKLNLLDSNVTHHLPCSTTLDGRRHQVKVETVWYRNGDVLNVNKGHKHHWMGDFQIIANKSLILPPKEKSTGVYQCAAKSIDLNSGNENRIISPRSFVEYPILKRLPAHSNVTAIRGLFFMFSCPVVSVPSANVTWYHGNVSIAKNLRENRFIVLINGSLIIRNVKESDRGKYKCIAENVYAVKTRRQFIWSLTVETPESASSGNPGLLPPLQPKVNYIEPGGNVKLQCDGAAEKIEWSFKDLSGTLQRVSNNSRVYELRAVTVDDDGFYTCSTENESQTFQVVVLQSPKIETKLQSWASAFAATVMLSCNATGRPRPEIVWYHNGMPVSNTHTRYIRESDDGLILHSVDAADIGTYQCFARNIAGENYTTGQLRLRRPEDIDELLPPPMKVACYPVNFHTVNITYNFDPSFSVMNIHTVRENPHRWNTIKPQPVQHPSFLAVPSELPVLEPFVLLMRGLVATSTKMTNNNIQEETLQPSALSEPVYCATQGIPLHSLQMTDGIFIWWTHLNNFTSKYYILQFLNDDRDSISELFPDGSQKVKVTTTAVTLNSDLIAAQLTEIRRITNSSAIESLQSGTDRNIFNLILPGNVTGVLIPNGSHHQLTVRLLIITAFNENFTQDLRYVEWKTIGNSQIEKIVDIVEIESRGVTFRRKFKTPCVRICIERIEDFPAEAIEGAACENRNLSSSTFEVRQLKPVTKYRFNFEDCPDSTWKSFQSYEEVALETRQDPPGPISNQKVTHEGGLRITWEPPLNPNGEIDAYMILWTLNNTTKVVNVSSNDREFKFPNVTKNDKINVTVHVVGRNGIGPPIYFDLTDVGNILPHNEESYLGPIIGGVVLSLCCVITFIFLYICLKKRMKRRLMQNEMTQSQSSYPKSNVSGYSLGSHGNTGSSVGVIHEYHEMQTLIPRGKHVKVISDRAMEMPNGNGICRRASNDSSNQQQTTTDDDFAVMPKALCCSTPKSQRRKDLSEILFEENLPTDAHEHRVPSSSLTNINTSKLQIREENDDIRLRNGGPSVLSPSSSNNSTVLPPKKHSITTVSPCESEVRSDDAKHALNSANSALHSFEENSSVSPTTTAVADDSRQQLLEVKYLDRNNDCQQQSKTNSICNKRPDNNNTTFQFHNTNDSLTNNSNASSFMPTTTNENSLTMITDLSGCSSFANESSCGPTKTGNFGPINPKVSWNHRRPVVDPNG